MQLQAQEKWLWPAGHAPWSDCRGPGWEHAVVSGRTLSAGVMARPGRLRRPHLRFLLERSLGATDPLSLGSPFSPEMFPQGSRGALATVISQAGAQDCCQCVLGVPTLEVEGELLPWLISTQRSPGLLLEGGTGGGSV